MVPEELELIKNAQIGDIRAFETLVYKYDSRVLSVALRYVGNEDDAKDIYQEVFIRAFRGIKNFQFKSEFSTWLFRITTNVCLTFKSRNKGRKYMSISENYDEDSSSDIELIDPDSSPEAGVSGNEIGYLIDQAVESLPPRQKMTFILKHYDGYKIREIAEILDCNEGTIKKYLFEATRKLREKLSFIMN